LVAEDAKTVAFCLYNWLKEISGTAGIDPIRRHGSQDEPVRGFQKSTIELLIDVKRILATNSKNYFIDFVSYGTPFDGDTMTVVDQKGNPLKDEEVGSGTKVKVCLFPGLAQYDWELPTLDEAGLNVEDVMSQTSVYRKDFFSITDAPPKNKLVIAKAKVLLAEQHGTREEGSEEDGEHESDPSEPS
jgi:hypothetical protein